MKQGRVSQTALKVALSLVTLSVKDDWAQRLPPRMAEMIERLLMASGQPGYGPRLMRMSRRPWMIRAYEVQDRILGQGLFEGFGHRKVFVQQQVEAAIEQGARQVLVLGAGFDTLCLRLAPQHPQVRFIEVDHPATSAAKARGIALERQSTNLIQVAADLGERPLSEVLCEEGCWDASRSSVLVAEGLFQYLADEDVRGLLVEAAASTSPRSRFVFTHAIPGHRRTLSIMTSLIGETWKSAVRSEDLPGYVEGTGWTMISDVDTDPAHGIERFAVAGRCSMHGRESDRTVPGTAHRPTGLCAGDLVPEIRTDRLLLRGFDGTEGSWLYELDNDPDVMRFINGGTHTTREFIENSSLALFRRTDWPVAETGFWKIVERCGSRPLGWCCLRVEETAADTGRLGYRLMRSAWGQGYASEASRALLEHGFGAIGLARIKATTYEENVRSRVVLERIGFRLVREYREDLGLQETASFDGTEAFPGLDLEFELRSEEWLRLNTTSDS